MKNKKNIVIISLALLLLLVLLVISMEYDRFLEPIIPNRPDPTEDTVVTGPDETVSDETIPGSENSDFDDEPGVTVPAEQNGNKEQSGDSQQPDDPNNEGGSRPEDTPTRPTQPQTLGQTEKPNKPDDTDPTEPTEPKPDPTEPAEKETDPVIPDKVDYRTYQDMTPEQQQAYMESFDSIEAFFDWYEKAKKEYEEAHPPIDVGDGNIDLEDIPGGNG